MFEKVQFNLEKCLAELHKYKKLQILSENELKKVVETRKSYEYKTMRSQKVLLDFIEYIEYEKMLEKIIKKRNINQKVKLEYITKRILNIYKLAIKHFNDERIIKMYVEYAMKKQKINNIKRFITSYMMKNPTNIDFVIYAADLCIQIDEIEMAKIIFLKSMRMNKYEKRLYYEFFRLELQNISKYVAINKEIGIRKDVDMSVCNNIIEQYKKNFDNNVECFMNMINDEDLKKMLTNNNIPV
ncbi:hypothetical protein BDAP_001137 [Binucleata daphniae]